MPTLQERHASIQAFGERYRYDMSYQTELLDSAPQAFDAFARAQGTSAHRQRLPLDAHYVARVAMMQAEDCRDCIQVNLRMAVEAGVPRELMLTLLHRPEELEPGLADVRAHAFDVSRGPTLDAERVERLRSRYGADGFAELAVCLAGCRLFTTAKRSLNKAQPGAVRDEDF